MRAAPDRQSGGANPRLKKRIKSENKAARVQGLFRNHGGHVRKSDRSQAEDLAIKERRNDMFEFLTCLFGILAFLSRPHRS